MTYDQIVAKIAKFWIQTVESRFSIGKLVDLACKSGHSVAELSRDTGVREGTLTRYAATHRYWLGARPRARLSWGDYETVALRNDDKLKARLLDGAERDVIWPRLAALRDRPLPLVPSNIATDSLTANLDGARSALGRIDRLRPKDRARVLVAFNRLSGALAAAGLFRVSA